MTEIEKVEASIWNDQTDFFLHIRDLLEIIKAQDARITELENRNERDDSYRREQNER